ncbi:hypothetical protein F4808DRAFT_406597 [Astrocystis sublimbata]|nr:hypothetical protein F4808DRAFT_406597 [Astrocystis sublimbata]
MGWKRSINTTVNVRSFSIFLATLPSTSRGVEIGDLCSGTLAIGPSRYCLHTIRSYPYPWYMYWQYLGMLCASLLKVNSWTFSIQLIFDQDGVINSVGSHGIRIRPWHLPSVSSEC